MVWSQLLFKNRQRPSIQWFGFRISSLCFVDQSQTIQDRGHILMIGSESFLVDRQCLLVEFLGFTVIALLIAQSCLCVEFRARRRGICGGAYLRDRYKQPKNSRGIPGRYCTLHLEFNDLDNTRHASVHPVRTPGTETQTKY